MKGFKGSKEGKGINGKGAGGTHHLLFGFQVVDDEAEQTERIVRHEAADAVVVDALPTGGIVVGMLVDGPRKEQDIWKIGGQLFCFRHGEGAIAVIGTVDDDACVGK